MDSLPLNVSRHFLSWDEPLLPQAVEYLAREWNRNGPLDLSTLLVLVPTRHSGRRLREALAAHAASHGAAVFPPQVLLPEALLAFDEAGVAAPLESQLAWAEILREIDLAAFRQVFPIDPPARDLAWSFRLASDFTKLQRTLAEAGWRLRDVLRRAEGGFPEAERWVQIAELEKRHAAKLARFRLRAATAARIERAAAPVLPNGISRIVLLAMPDPQPLALRALGELALQAPVEVVIFAGAEAAENFDPWGRPIEASWTSHLLDIPQFEQRVHLCADPADQAARASAAAAGYVQREGRFALGVGEPALAAAIESALRERQLPVFNPEGRPRRGDSLAQLVQALVRLAGEDTFAAVEALARCPDFLGFLQQRLGTGFSAAHFLAALDRLHKNHLPPTLAEALRHNPDNTALQVTAELRTALVAEKFPASLVGALRQIFAGRTFDLSTDDDLAAAESAEVWMNLAGQVAAAAEKFPGPTPTEWCDIVLRLYGETVRYEEKSPDAVELQGWLELLWEDAPHLVVTGFNDGAVPDAVVGDPFLPESLRQRLGLKTNAARFARDAYILHAIAQCRRREGRLDILLGKASEAGDPLRPSRLLLRCADDHLPARVAFLFRDVDPVRQSLPWRRAWRLTPRQVPAPERIAVTDFRRWLECPLRFYLSRVLKMQPVDPEKTELDVFDFGTLCHTALETLGHNAGMRDCTDAATLREFLQAQLETEVARRFGRELTLPLIVQIESARQRLAWAAEAQARTRAEGWVIEAVEQPFEIEIGGLRVVGKIDRIDRHETTNAVRVLDYKTSDTAATPVEAHVRGPRRTDEAAPEFARFVLNGRERVWKDLQLPLYRRAVAHRAAGHPLDAGYFNLPKAASEVSIRDWDEYTSELDEQAWRCAQGVVAAIRNGEFWPPNEGIRPERDDFAALFHHGVADSVEWRAGDAESAMKGSIASATVLAPKGSAVPRAEDISPASGLQKSPTT